jgi:hypothetical protein
MLYGGGRFLCRLVSDCATPRSMNRPGVEHMQRRTYARLRELAIRLLNRSTAELAKIAQALGRGRLTRGRGGGIK